MFVTLCAVLITFETVLTGLERTYVARNSSIDILSREKTSIESKISGNVGTIADKLQERLTIRKVDLAVANKNLSDAITLTNNKTDSQNDRRLKGAKKTKKEAQERVDNLNGCSWYSDCSGYTQKVENTERELIEAIAAVKQIQAIIINDSDGDGGHIKGLRLDVKEIRKSISILEGKIDGATISDKELEESSKRLIKVEQELDEERKKNIMYILGDHVQSFSTMASGEGNTNEKLTDEFVKTVTMWFSMSLAAVAALMGPAIATAYFVLTAQNEKKPFFRNWTAAILRKKRKPTEIEIERIEEVIVEVPVVEVKEIIVEVPIETVIVKHVPIYTDNEDLVQITNEFKGEQIILKSKLDIGEDNEQTVD